MLPSLLHSSRRSAAAGSGGGYSKGDWPQEIRVVVWEREAAGGGAWGGVEGEGDIGKRKGGREETNR